MKRKMWALLLLGSALAAGMIGRVVRADEDKKAAIEMHWFVIESKHTGPGCLASLDEMNKKNLLDKTYFGCMTGDHRGWTILQAESSEAALNMFPASERANAHVVQVSKFSPEDLIEIHSKKG
jgi:hypothetical protein